MAANAELRINLAALKRQDPYISNITDSSTHVAVYSFSPQSNEWEKTDVEGTLFVYKRVAPPHWGFTIMNRLSMENLTEPLTSELEFQTQNPFLLYRNAKLLIYGIWFYDQDDCKRVGELLERLCRESSQALNNVQNGNVPRVNIFSGSEITPQQEPPPKSLSPNSNSATSASPGSSVGGIQRRPSNPEEADSESEDKEVAQNNKGSINILDLLSKAQDKYEKEKRNTPDPAVDVVQNGPMLSPTDAERSLIKPVPVKPSHPQKLDVATLFKQHPTKPPDTNATLNELQTGKVPPATVPLPAMTAPFGGMMLPQHMGKSAVPQSANMNIPQVQPQQRRPNMVRSFSMTEMQLRQQATSLSSYMNGGMMSVEEVEASLSQNAVTSREQQVTQTLDKLINHINLTGGLPATGPTLPGIQENTIHGLGTKASGGNSGSMVINGNSIQSPYGSDDVFQKQTRNNPFASAGARFSNSNPLSIKTSSNVPRQRSISTSGIQLPPVRLLPGAPTAPITTHARTFPDMSTATQLARKPIPATSGTTSSVPLSTVPLRSESGLLLHGNAVISEEPEIPNSSNLAAPTASVPALEKNKNPVSSLTKVNDLSSSAVTATLISPEDFERSATTPQKKLEIKNKLLREIPPATQNLATLPPAGPNPLTKEQLQQTLVSLLTNDPVFLASIHNAYMTNFKQS